MPHPLRLGIILASSAAFLGVAPREAHGQTRPLYVTHGYHAGDAAPIFVLQGGVVARTIVPASRRGYALAVSGDVRSLGVATGYTGSRYTLGGTPIGAPYDLVPDGESFYDGTTDGSRYNYTVSVRGGYPAVYRANRDWTGLTPLFTVPTQGGRVGITYDAGANSLWLASRSDVVQSDGDFRNVVEQYSLSGELLSSFTLTGSWGSIEAPSALAYDPVDQSLWLAGGHTWGPIEPGWLYQFSRTGDLLSSVQLPPDQRAAHYLAGEFDMTAVPEPATLALVAAGALVVGVFARGRKA